MCLCVKKSANKKLFIDLTGEHHLSKKISICIV